MTGAPVQRIFVVPFEQTAEEAWRELVSPIFWSNLLGAESSRSIHLSSVLGSQKTELADNMRLRFSYSGGMVELEVKNDESNENLSHVHISASTDVVAPKAERISQYLYYKNASEPLSEAARYRHRIKLQALTWSLTLIFGSSLLLLHNVLDLSFFNLENTSAEYNNSATAYVLMDILLFLSSVATYIVTISVVSLFPAAFLALPIAHFYRKASNAPRLIDLIKTFYTRSHWEPAPLIIKKSKLTAGDSLVFGEWHEKQNTVGLLGSVKGVFAGHEFRLLQTNATTVSWRFTLRGYYPHIYLQNKHSKSLLKFPIDNKHRISLEGNMDDHFSVYTTKGNDSEAREVLTPDVMLQLIDYLQPFDIEVYGRKLYIHTRASNFRDSFWLSRCLVALHNLLPEFRNKKGSHETGTIAIPRLNFKKILIKWPFVSNWLRVTLFFYVLVVAYWLLGGMPSEWEGKELAGILIEIFVVAPNMLGMASLVFGMMIYLAYLMAYKIIRDDPLEVFKKVKYDFIPDEGAEAIEEPGEKTTYEDENRATKDSLNIDGPLDLRQA